MRVFLVSMTWRVIFLWPFVTTPFGALGVPIRVPYPVTFRLLGDEAGGSLRTRTRPTILH